MLCQLCFLRRRNDHIDEQIPYNWTYSACRPCFRTARDIWFDLKLIYPNEDGIFTYLGFFSFMFGHLTLTAGLICCFFAPENLLAFGLILLVSVVFAFVILKLEKTMKLDYRNFKAILFAYSAALIMILLCCLYLSAVNSFSSTLFNLMFIGKLLLLVSDLVLSRSYFGKDSNALIVANGITYFAAQFVLADAILSTGGLSAI